MIIGTAGHIDHGKTALVKALTGINTDRLADEQKRGITIALGYAYEPLSNGDVLGYVDVPGHESLVHTMVSGATGIDYAMLVVAADDGVMPQTHEHIAILSLLGLQQGCVVITKKDRVSSEAIQQLQSELQPLLQNTFLATAPYFVVDSLSHVGIAELKQHLVTAAQEQSTARPDGFFRLAIDRVFSLDGQGTIVTGTVQSGHYELDNSERVLHLMPAGEPVRVRRIHAQNTPSQTASAGQRCALNLAGIAKHSIQRGDWIADPLCFVPSLRIDVSVSLSAQATHALKTWTPVHLHIGAAHYLAHVVPLSQDQIQPGQTAIAQLVLTEPICALPRDRFILRNAQAKMTIGGGVVLDPNAPDRKRRSLARLAWLDGVQNMIEGRGLTALLHQAPYGLPETFLLRLTGLSTLEQWSAPDAALWIAGGRSTERVLIHNNAWEHLLARIETGLAEFHERYPDEPGVELARLRRMVAPRITESLWLAVLDALIQRQRVAVNGPWYHLTAHTVSFSADEEVIAQKVIEYALAGRYDPPWVRDVAGALDIPELQIRSVGRKLVRQGVLFQVVRDLYYHRDHIIELATQISNLTGNNKSLKAADFRDHIQLGRKRTVQLLEFFERIGYTRRVRDSHLLRRESIRIW